MFGVCIHTHTERDMHTYEGRQIMSSPKKKKPAQMNHFLMLTTTIMISIASHTSFGEREKGREINWASTTQTKNAHKYIFSNQ